MTSHLSLYAMMARIAHPKKAAKKTKKKLDNWFEGRTCQELKTLCKAAKLQVSGTKPELGKRLMQHIFTANLECESLPSLKEKCRQRLLQVSGSKYDLMLRLLYDEYQTGTAKRAATEAVMDNATGETTQVVKKKRKTAATPERLYEKVCKQIQAVRQKQYQSYYGAKNHAGAVFWLMGNLIQEEVLDNKAVITSDPILALELAKAPFQALYDLWSTMGRPEYGGFEYENSLRLLEKVLVEIQARISAEQIEELVCLLESVEACVSGYCIDEEKVNEQVIRTIMPGYNKEHRDRKKSEISAMAWMNGSHTYESPS
jgi:hypothetical protein